MSMNTSTSEKSAGAKCLRGGMVGIGMMPKWFHLVLASIAIPLSVVSLVLAHFMARRNFMLQNRIRLAIDG